MLSANLCLLLVLYVYHVYRYIPLYMYIHVCIPMYTMNSFMNSNVPWSRGSAAGLHATLIIFLIIIIIIIIIMYTVKANDQ